MLRGHLRKRDEYVAARIQPQGLFAEVQSFFKGFQVCKRLLLCALTSFLLCLTIRAWNPPFTFIGGVSPERDIICMTPFSIDSPSMTKEDKDSARFDTPHIYVHDSTKLSQLKEKLINRVKSILPAASYDAMSDDEKIAWNDFLPGDATPESAAESLEVFQKALAEDTELKAFKDAIDKAFQGYAKNGILLNLHPAKSGNQETIRVYDAGSPASETRDVPARDVLVGNMFQIKDSLNWDYAPGVSQLIFNWIKKNLEPTLSEDQEATRIAQEEAENQVQVHKIQYENGKTIVKGGVPITQEELRLLSEEHRVHIKSLSIYEKLVRSAGFFLVLFVATFIINVLIYFRRDKTHKGEKNLKTSLAVFVLMTMTVFLGSLLQQYFCEQFGVLEVIPLLIFTQALSLAFSWQIGFIVSFLLVLVLSLCGNNELAPFLVMTGTVTTAAFLTQNIQRRTDLLLASLAEMAVAFLLSIGVGFLEYKYVPLDLFRTSVLTACWVLAAALITEAILPILENCFNILTPMRISDIGNPSNPILQDLNNKAPATYNHSLSTATLAENAAKRIGAQTRLVRVGAYFHDIGKMLKSDYFTENQHGVNPHDKLEPKMSTMIITSHVKDGVSMAQQRHIPRKIVDLIEQHHGTLPVMYFYDKANKASIAAGTGEIDKNEFRYPGPIPQSKEAAILMLADAVESASRTWGDAPTNRIENSIHQIVEARIQDGQFDECGLTLGEIRAIEQELLTTVLSMKHIRIKYPGQEEEESKAKAGE